MQKTSTALLSLIGLLLLTALSFSACKDKKEKEEMDAHFTASLIETNQRQKAELEELNEIISTVSAGLDAISAQENILLTGRTTDGAVLDRKQIAENLNHMANVLQQQRQKIKNLQDSLSHRSSTESVAKMQRIIDVLNEQLAEKDRVIQSLRADLNNSRKDITQLRASLAEMRTRSEKAEKKNETYKQALTTQDEVLNECYIKIGTKKQLKAAGLLKGGFLAKKKINYENVSKQGFTAIDIRKTREIPLKSGSPKILSPMPNSRSFHFEDNGDGTCTLNITNPTVFWSISNYLIIQL